MLLRRPHGDTTALLSERRVCFEHVQSARRRPFYAISRRSLAMPLRCLRFHGAQVGVLDFFKTPSLGDSYITQHV